MYVLPSPQAEAALAYLAADEEALHAIRSGDRERIGKAIAALVAATERRSELSDPRYQ